MFQFPEFASYTLCIQMQIPYHNAWKPKPYQSTAWILQAFKVGSPIRKSMDQSLFAAPHGLSQRITSFFACACQGIHQMPLIHFFVLIANAHQYSSLQRSKRKGYLLQPNLLMMPSTCSTSLLFWGHAERPACKLVFKTSFSRLNPGPRG